MTVCRQDCGDGYAFLMRSPDPAPEADDDAEDTMIKRNLKVESKARFPSPPDVLILSLDSPSDFVEVAVRVPWAAWERAWQEAFGAPSLPRSLLVEGRAMTKAAH